MKNQSARVEPINNLDSVLRLATVNSELKGEYRLDENGFKFCAKIAFSCLVTPLPGDVVLYANVASGQNIIVAIVERAGDQSMGIEFPNNVNFTSKAGSIGITADESISMFSSSMNMFSHTMVQKSEESYLEVGEMNAHGKKLNANFNSMFLVSNFINTMAKQMINKFKTYIRHSENFDQVKATNMTRSVEQLYTLNSKQTVMLSSKDTKIDGERIHIG